MQNIHGGTSSIDILIYTETRRRHCRRSLPSFHTSATPSLSCFYPKVFPEDSKSNPEPSIRAQVRQTSATEVLQCPFPLWKEEAEEPVSPLEELAGLRCCPLPDKMGVRERPGPQTSNSSTPLVTKTMQVQKQCHTYQLHCLSPATTAFASYLPQCYFSTKFYPNYKLFFQTLLL